MTTWKELSAPLRLTIAAPWCLLVALLFGGAAGMIEVKIDGTTHQPVNTTVSLSGASWTGTLDAGRLPTVVPRYDAEENIFFGTAFIGHSGGGLKFNNEGTTDGFGNWRGIGSLVANDSLTTTQILSYGGHPSIDLSDPASLVVRDDGISVAVFSYGGVNLPGVLSVGGESDFSGGNIAFMNDGSADFNGGIVANGAFYGASVATSGAIQVNDGAVSLDEYGNGSFGGDVNVGGGVAASGSGTFYGDLSADAIFSSGYQVTDPWGNLYGGGWIVGTGDGYLQTGSQSYTDGVIAPTGCIAIKDATGNVYLVPATAQ